MTLQERLAMSQGQDNGMSIILGGIPAVNQEQVQQLPVTALRPKSNHTFKVRRDSAHYGALKESIRCSGVKTPLLVRRDPAQPGSYEIIAGHTRWTAATELELATVPCIVAQLSDTDADILMAETNIQRPDWLPSERAKSYKVWLEAIQNETGIKQGQRTDLTSVSHLPKLTRPRDLAAQRFGISGPMLSLYIQLNDLLPELLELVDGNVADPKRGIQVMAGYQLAFLPTEQQETVLAWLTEHPEYLMKENSAKMLRQVDFQAEWEIDELLEEKPREKDNSAKPKQIKFSVLAELLPEGAKQLTKDPAFQAALTTWIKQYVEKEVKA